MRHSAAEKLPRHCHREPFAAVVLAGGYDEAGDTGRHRVGAGDVIFHKPFESHLDLFHQPGAEVLVLPLPRDWTGPAVGRLEDADAVARSAEKDVQEALGLFASGVTARQAQVHDWPDALAQALQANPSLSLASWAEAAGLHPGSLGRGFAAVFGIAPAAYRLTQRVQRALALLQGAETPLSEVAAECGFSDQAHMTRSIRTVTGSSPASLKRQLVGA